MGRLTKHSEACAHNTSWYSKCFSTQYLNISDSSKLHLLGGSVHVFPKESQIQTQFDLITTRNPQRSWREPEHVQAFPSKTRTRSWICRPLALSRKLGYPQASWWQKRRNGEEQKRRRIGGSFKSVKWMSGNNRKKQEVKDKRQFRLPSESFNYRICLELIREVSHSAFYNNSDCRKLGGLP